MENPVNPQFHSFLMHNMQRHQHACKSPFELKKKTKALFPSASSLAVKPWDLFLNLNRSGWLRRALNTCHKQGLFQFQEIPGWDCHIYVIDLSLCTTADGACHARRVGRIGYNALVLCAFKYSLHFKPTYSKTGFHTYRSNLRCCTFSWHFISFISFNMLGEMWC